MTEQDKQTALGKLTDPERPQVYTLTEIAAACGISRQAIYKRLQSDGQLRQEVDALCVTRRGHRVYTVDALERLKQVFLSPECKPAGAVYVNQCQPEVDRLTTEVNRLTNEVDTERQKHAETRDRLTTEVDTLTRERGQLRQQLEDVTADRDKLAAERDALRDQLEGLRRDLTESRAKLEALTEERDRLRGELDRAAATVDQLRQDHRAELAAVRRGHAAELDRIQEAHRQQLDDMRAQLEALRAELTEERQHSRDTAERLAQLADQAQRLQLAQMQPPAQIPERKPSLWARLFGKHKHDFDIEGGQDHSPD
jgi:DNA repair exonuclease SbcCD ATPase subunit